jgi:hypothetical protein
MHQARLKPSGAPIARFKREQLSLPPEHQLMGLLAAAQQKVLDLFSLSFSFFYFLFSFSFLNLKF